jgi:hypothetical protein
MGGARAGPEVQGATRTTAGVRATEVEQSTGATETLAIRDLCSPTVLPAASRGFIVEIVFTGELRRRDDLLICKERDVLKTVRHKSWLTRS